MTNKFVEFIRETDGFSLVDFTRDGYKTLFISIENDSLRDEFNIRTKAETSGYTHYLGIATNRDTGERVHVFSKEHDVNIPPLYSTVENN